MSRPFTDVLREIKAGDLVDDASAELARVLLAVVANGKRGSLTMTLTISPDGANAVTIDGEVKVKVPKPAIGKAIFFVNEEGDASRRDPRQREMFTEVKAPAGSKLREMLDEDDEEGRLKAAAE